MVGDCCGILLERGVVGGDGMLGWGNDGGGMLYGGEGGNGAGGIRGVCMYVYNTYFWKHAKYGG